MSRPPGAVLRPRIRVLALLLAFALLLTACAETDPYKRIEPAPTPQLEGDQAAEVFSGRWPGRFKTVQTVTIDFRVKTMTLVGYLIVQGDSFRLQGMTEQGLRLFDIAHHEGETRTVFAADEFDEKIIRNISRDIRRVFTNQWRGNETINWKPVEVRMDEHGATACAEHRGGRLPIRLTGTPPLVDWYEYNLDGRNLFRVDHYEWREFDGHFVPSIIVLRERGVVSDGPSYKLTIKITELENREQPWPAGVFNPPAQKPHEGEDE